MLKQRAAAAVLLTTIILSFSMTIIPEGENPIYFSFQNQFDTTQQFITSSLVVLGINTNSTPELNQTTRSQIYSLIRDNPGIHFRGICSSLNLPVGMVQYHLNILVATGLLTCYSDGKMRRFFETSKYSSIQMKIMSLLRHKTRGQILEIVNVNKTATHSDLANQLSITSQGLTWQIHRLEEAGIIKEKSNGLKKTYCINNDYSDLVSELLSTIK